MTCLSGVSRIVHILISLVSQRLAFDSASMC